MEADEMMDKSGRGMFGARKGRKGGGKGTLRKGHAKLYDSRLVQLRVP